MNEVMVNRADLTNIVNAVRAVNAQQLQIANAVDGVAATQDRTRSELGDLRSQFETFLRRDILDKNLLNAKSDLQIEQTNFDKEFGHYEGVRRQATGILQALDAGIVTRSTIYQVTEGMMLGTPRYWLAPALVALAGWIRDDRVLAERALAEAVRREPGKTALFFTLVLRRNGRSEATARWLWQYIAGQNPAALPHEFIVVLDAVATGAFGPEARPVVLSHLTEWYARIRTDQATVGAQVARWEKLIDGMRRNQALTFPILKEISPTWPKLRELYARATVFEQANAYFHGIFDGPLPVGDDLQRKVDDILTNLVTNFDDEERPMKAKLDGLNAIIAHDGDKEAAARTIAAEESLREDRVDIMTLLTDAAFYPERLGASLATRRLSVALTGEWIVEAAGRLEAANAAGVPKAVELKIEDWRGVIDASTTEQAIVASVTGHLHRRTEEAVAATGVGAAGVLGMVAGVASLLFAVLAAIGGSLPAAVVLLLLVVASGGWTFVQYQRRDRRRAELRELGQRRKATAAANVNGAIAECRDWWEQWQHELANARLLHDYLKGHVRDAHIRGAHSREVLD
jgi:hypothetical protein